MPLPRWMRPSIGDLNGKKTKRLKGKSLERSTPGGDARVQPLAFCFTHAREAGRVAKLPTGGLLLLGLRPSRCRPSPHAVCPPSMTKV